MTYLDSSKVSLHIPISNLEQSLEKLLQGRLETIYKSSDQRLTPKVEGFIKQGATGVCPGCHDKMKNTLPTFAKETKLGQIASTLEDRISIPSESDKSMKQSEINRMQPNTDKCKAGMINQSHK